MNKLAMQMKSQRSHFQLCLSLAPPTKVLFGEILIHMQLLADDPNLNLLLEFPNDIWPQNKPDSVISYALVGGKI